MKVLQFKSTLYCLGKVRDKEILKGVAGHCWQDKEGSSCASIIK